MSKVVTTTTATNKKLRELLTGIRNKTLIPDPNFQRRLVWTNKDKVKFLETVLGGYPFPEIYTAAGTVDSETGEGDELLVDGQQRMTTLYQYFTGSPEIRLPTHIPLYSELDEKLKLEFLEYVVVVRDLGPLSIEEIKEVFTRINSTKYSLNAMEINNARYDGEFKKFGEKLAAHEFFENHRVFSAYDIRRMEDVKYTLTIVATTLSSYFKRDDELETFLQQYNDEFPQADKVLSDLELIFEFIERCNFPPDSRIWKKADLFTLIIELYKIMIQQGLELDPVHVGQELDTFYYEVDHRDVPDNQLSFPRKEVEKYAAAIYQATNDRTKRMERASVISSIIMSLLVR